MKTTQKTKNIKIFAVMAAIYIFTSIAPALASEITPDKMVELTNAARSESGLARLEVNPKLEKAAEAKAKDMLSKQYFEHTSPEGLTPWYWFGLAGYTYVYAAENLAMDFITAEGAHNALMKSTGHRENILGKNYQEMGIAVISGSFEGKETIMIVEEFGSQREPKITINNVQFFETIEVQDKEAESVKTEAAPASVAKAKTPQAAIVKERKIETAVEIIHTPAVEKVTVLTDGKQGEDDKSFSPIVTDQDSGKAIPKVYSVRKVGELKRVYAEDIYWKQGNERYEILPLGSYEVDIEDFLRSMIGSLMQAVFQE